MGEESACIRTTRKTEVCMYETGIAQASFVENFVTSTEQQY